MAERVRSGSRWWRPLSARHPESRYAYSETPTARPIDDPSEGGIVRLIGLELRLRHPMGIVEEVQMVPLDIELTGCGNSAYGWSFGPLTLHTSVGDVNIPEVRIPASGL